MLLLALCLVDILVTYLVGQYWVAYAQLIGISLALVSAVVIRDARRFWFVVAVLAIYSVCVSVAYVRRGFEVADSDILGTNDAVNTLIADRNYISMECAIGIIVGWCLLLGDGLGLTLNRWLSRGISIAGLFPIAVCGYGLVQTQSRGGVITVLGGMIAVMLHRIRTRWRVIAIVVVVGCASLPVLRNSFLVEGLLDRFQDQEEVGQLSKRVWIWRDIIKEYVHGDFSEMLLGRGVGACEAATGYSTHNTVLRILFDQGFLGLGLLLVLFTLILWRVWQRKDDTGTMQFGFLCLCALGSISLEPHYFLPVFGIVFGLSAAVPSGERLASNSVTTHDRRSGRTLAKRKRFSPVSASGAS